ncbi:LysM peptidoglycan-binding domain-containing protein [Petrotoga sp. 9PWA.NaAc.5.4]|uniref:LysM peptidoglycan-binding domain-containing protein n=1 Tax=Petrotoga sp. 9PWA.NaAc.5.4 TaxID=1434328 RepID=UPI000CB9F8D3|nr:M23 family metallopeptidase [Petrotoga sp. 9PWA.NaAc.5.4]PNR96756.1 peptidoglycan-binding protein [Petrotoga sp. 9PWA.NaAc.5.4]
MNSFHKRQLVVSLLFIFYVSLFSYYSIVDHVVQPNDTLYSISSKYDVSISTILDWNSNISPKNLKVGQILKIPQPDGFVYEVEKGDTLTYIAKLFFTSVEDIMKSNKLSNTNVYVGQKLFIPTSIIGKGFNKEKDIIWPVYGTISSSYGWRVHPITGEYSLHKGVDLSSPQGAPVFAAESGKVVFTGENGGYGLMIEIESGDTNYIYGHLSKISVYEGQYVRKGQLIARVGNTGLSTGPHLHFEVKKADKLYDPLVFLPSSNRIYVLDNRENIYGIGGK